MSHGASAAGAGAVRGGGGRAARGGAEGGQRAGGGRAQQRLVAPRAAAAPAAPAGLPGAAVGAPALGLVLRGWRGCHAGCVGAQVGGCVGALAGTRLWQHVSCRGGSERLPQHARFLRTDHERVKSPAHPQLIAAVQQRSTPSFTAGGWRLTDAASSIPAMLTRVSAGLGRAGGRCRRERACPGAAGTATTTCCPPSSPS